jgi:hypothetical protein
MALKLLDVGAVQMLKKYFNTTTPAGGNNLTLNLFVNNVTPTDTGITYTPCTITGYSAVSLVDGNWTVLAEDAVLTDGIPRAKYNEQCQFTFTGGFGQTIYGYYVTDADGVIIYAERSSEPWAPTVAGDMLLITPVFQLSYGTPA